MKATVCKNDLFKRISTTRYKTQVKLSNNNKHAL